MSDLAYSGGRAAVPVVARLSGVRKRYGENTVLDNVDFSVREGEFVALVGPSGTGKTTLLRLLAGLESASNGRTEVSGNTSVVFQEPRLIQAQRVWKNVLLDDAHQPDARSRAAAALQDVGLEDKLESWPVSLSGGQAQRVAVARALYRRPDLMLLDEPFSALDAFTRRSMQSLVLKLWAKYAFGAVIVTHDLDEALIVADRIVILSKGRICHETRVDLPRERDVTSPEFNALKRDLLKQFSLSLS
ncbi:ABC transporter ATP-binding protein [Paraburkholderia lycopersici]|uniref:Sulfonate transport system ATP-binding protein n=1 Tax=Paraburkholderia lycopersici TaxID=416944 RepID=A0A1G6TPY3_9BURK|nr:ABC transporter ATP-binding protein [Paraburkholderia lycopersici]SDD31168.1 sulfonate transport system ATP-binding protein [Paraburkholderia lycopersici]